MKSKNISAVFIDEFLENFLDQLESMREEIISKENINPLEAEKMVLEKCDPIEDVINHVLELYDSQERPDFWSPRSIISSVAILRILIIIQLFLLYFSTFKSWEWNSIPNSQIFYSAAVDIHQLTILVMFVMIILIIDALLLKKAEKYELGNERFTFLINKSIFKIHYRIVMILCLIPALVPFYLYIYLDPPYWILRGSVFVAIIITTSTLEWVLEFPHEINLPDLYKSINPLLIFSTYIFLITSFNVFGVGILRIITLMVFNSNQDVSDSSTEYLWIGNLLSLLFIIGIYGFWRDYRDKGQVTLKNQGKYLLVWLLTITFLLLIIVVGEGILNEVYPTWQFYDEFIQTPYSIIFFLIVIFFSINIPQIKSYSIKLWVFLGWILYSMTIISALNFQLSLANFTRENKFMNYTIYFNSFQLHMIFMIFLGIITFLIMLLALFAQKQHLRKNHNVLQLYSWLFRTYLFFMLYEIGVVNLFLYHLGNLSRVLTTPAIATVCFINCLILILFMSLEGIVEIVMFQMLSHQTGILWILRNLNQIEKVKRSSPSVHK